MDRLAKKFETARTLVPAPVITEDAGAEIGVIAFGSTHWAMIESRDQLRAEGIPTGYLLLKALPFSAEVMRFVAKYARVYVVEQNRDGQMAELLRLEAHEHAPKLRSVRHYTGLPIDARSITDEILRLERGESGTKPAGARAAVAEGASR